MGTGPYDREPCATMMRTDGATLSRGGMPGGSHAAAGSIRRGATPPGGRARAGRRRPAAPAASHGFEWLELWPTAAALLDGASTVIASNSTFRRRAIDGAGLSIVDGRVILPADAAVRRLGALIASVLASGRDAALSLPAADGIGGLEIAVRRVPRTLCARAVLLVVHDVTADRVICTDRVRELYGLTRTQVAVVQALVADPGLGPVARALGLSQHTVRAHLKQIFAKCGVHSQSELLQRLALGAARRGSAQP